MAHLLRGMAADGTLRVVAADTTDLVAEALGRHETGATAGAALGRTLTASLLLAHVLLKDHRDRVTVKLDGRRTARRRDRRRRPRRHRPGVRALRPETELPPARRRQARRGRARSAATARSRSSASHAPYGDPYASSVRLASGEVAEDVATFLARSEQIASAVLLGVSFAEGRPGTPASRRVRAPAA
jgi:molecular chaperone Hsp33